MDPGIPTAKFERPAPDDHVGIIEGRRLMPTLESVLNTLTRRRWLIVAVALLGTAAAVFAGSRITPTYTAVALIELERESTNIPDLKLVFDASGDYAGSADSQVSTEVQRLTSREHMKRVAKHLQATGKTDLGPTLTDDEGGVSRVISEAGEYLRNWVSDHWLATVDAAVQTLSIPSSDQPEQVDDARQPEQELAAESASGLAKGLNVRQQGYSYVISVSYTSDDPETAATVVNAVVDLYVEAQVQRNRARAINASAWLGNRVTALKREVESAEAALELYRVATNIVTKGAARVNDLQVVDLTRELITARAELSGLEARLDLAHRLGRQGQTADTLLEVLSSPLIVDLRRQESDLSRVEGELSATLGPEHPRMLLLAAEKEKLTDKIALEINRIIAQMENEGNIAAERVSAIEARLATAQEATERIQSAEAGFDRLERAAEASRRHYERFLDRYYEAQEQQLIVDAGLRVISSAVPPERPSTPGPALFAVMGFTLSTLAGTMLAFLFDRFDKGVRSDEEVQRLLGAPRIGLIPRLGRRQRPPHRYLLSRPLSVYAEAVREVFAHCHLHQSQRSSVIVITSSVPEEGKTTLSISLAVCAAHASHRVILIDLDLRHPTLSRELGFKSMAMGITDHILDGAPLAEVVSHNQAFGFDIIATGRRHSDPTSLLTSDKMATLLDDLRQKYDIIIVDSPPVLGITDARIFAQRADSVAFVVQWGRTPASLAQSAVKLLLRAGANITGVVLTQANIKQHARYGYGDTGTFYNKYHRYYQG